MYICAYDCCMLIWKWIVPDCLLFLFNTLLFVNLCSFFLSSCLNCLPILSPLLLLQSVYACFPYLQTKDFRTTAAIVSFSVTYVLFGISFVHQLFYVPLFYTTHNDKQVSVLINVFTQKNTSSPHIMHWANIRPIHDFQPKSIITFDHNLLVKIYVNFCLKHTWRCLRSHMIDK